VILLCCGDKQPKHIKRKQKLAETLCWEKNCRHSSRNFPQLAVDAAIVALISALTVSVTNNNARSQAFRTVKLCRSLPVAAAVSWSARPERRICRVA
jgi:hypothetical protein